MSKENLRSQISSKAISALIMEEADHLFASDFLSMAYHLVFENPSALTPEWVKRINRWGNLTMQDALNEHKIEYAKGEYLDIGPLKVKKKIYTKAKVKNKRVQYNFDNARAEDKKHYKIFVDYIAIDRHGWKYWYRDFRKLEGIIQKKDSFPKTKSIVFLTNAYIRDIRTGITFLGSINRIDVLDKSKFSNYFK